jgi:hypothetical protein
MGASMGRAPIPTGNRQQDYNQPLFKQAEERVWAWLLGQADRTGQPLADYRSFHIYHDFLYAGHTVDVKVDQKALASGRVAWEESIWHGKPDGPAEGIQRTDGWGMDQRLDYVVYVLPKGDEEKWPAMLVDNGLWRSAILGADPRSKPGQFAPFWKQGDDRAAVGFLPTLEFLRTCGALVREFEV